MPRPRIELYYDVISPYAWLALRQVEAFAQANDVEFEPRAVVYAALLTAEGLIGPAESDNKRRYTITDIARLAAHRGYPLTGPPTHPFRSLEAQRTATLFADTPQSLALAIALADAAWAHGRDLTNIDVLAEVVRGCGLDGADLVRRITTDENKQRLRGTTEQAIARGVFGVPTFALVGPPEQLFWGQDRLPLLAAALSGQGPEPASIERILARPRGVDRRR